MVLARGAGMIGRRIAPSIMRMGRNAYMRNPEAFRANTYRAFSAAGSIGSAIAGRIKRKRTTNRVQPYPTPRKSGARSVNSGTYNPVQSGVMNEPPVGGFGGGRGSYGQASMNKRGRKRRRTYKKSKRSKSSKWSYGKCQSSGMAGCQETTLSVEDNDCVYVVAGAQPPQPMVVIVVQSLIRKLFEKYGKVQVTGADSSKWPGFTYNNQGGWGVHLLVIDTTTNAISVNTEYTVSNGDSLVDIAANFY